MAVPGYAQGVDNEAVNALSSPSTTQSPQFLALSHLSKVSRFSGGHCASVNRAEPCTASSIVAWPLFVETSSPSTRDAGVNGSCGDAAVTLIPGPCGPEVQKLFDVTSETMESSGHPRHARCETWLEVASLMERFVKSQGLYAIEKFVGTLYSAKTMHGGASGIPTLLVNRSGNSTSSWKPGVILVIDEPMVALETKDVRTPDDGFTDRSGDQRSTQEKRALRAWSRER